MKRKNASENFELIFNDFVDYLMPELVPYEASLYLFLLRNSLLRDGTIQIRIGKRSMAQGYGTGSRGKKTNYTHMTRVISGLEVKGCLRVGNTTREGTLYTILLPRDIPLVKEHITNIKISSEDEDDYFTDPKKRQILFERDNWTCQYCGELVSQDNATLDHFVPQSKGGAHSKDNLRTACLVCNGVKSGKSFEEAAPAILCSITQRQKRSQ